MVLNNYWNWQAALKNAGTSVAAKPCNLTDMNGDSVTAIYIGTGTTLAYPSQNCCFDSNLYSCFSTSETDLDADDYVMDDVVDCGTPPVGGVTYDTTNGFKRTIKCSGINMTGAKVTIKKLGIYKKIIINDQGTTKDILLASCVLNSPVEIPKNALFSLFFDWTMN